MSDITVTYIGEMLRYLATAKESPYEKQHQIRGIFGNGLRPDVWKVFEERFNISNIIELLKKICFLFALRY